MIVRRANPNDAHAIALVHVHAWRTAYRHLVSDAELDRLDVERRAAAWGLRLRDASWPVYVLDDGGVVRGFCSTGRCEDSDVDSDKTAEIPAIYLDPGIWGQGHGRELCETVIDDLENSGLSEIVLWAFTGNERARRFFEAMGFEADGTTRKHPRMDRDLIRYRRSVGRGI